MTTKLSVETYDVFGEVDPEGKLVQYANPRSMCATPGDWVKREDAIALEQRLAEALAEPTNEDIAVAVAGACAEYERCANTAFSDEQRGMRAAVAAVIAARRERLG